MKKIFQFIFNTSFKYKKLLIKENIFTDKEENFTVLFRVIKKVINFNLNYTIIDVGAFDGKSAINFSQQFSKYKIVAFEPNPHIFEDAKQNTKNFPNITLHQIALSESSGCIEFNVTKNSVSSSLNLISEKIAEEEGYGNELSIIKKELVKTKPLDDFIFESEILFIKIDTQGNEIRVLNGAKNILKKTLFVLVEMSNHNIYANGCKYYEVDEWFRKNGFKLVDIIISCRKKGVFVNEYDAIYANLNKVSL